MDKIRLGVSACLLGQKVRYDGGHKHDRYLTDTLGQWVDYTPVCPEAEAGLGVPREAMRLTGDPAAPRLMTVRTGRDLTELMTGFAARRAEELAGQGLDGFIFKAGSPSSGMERVKVYGPGGMPAKKGVGLFAAALMARLPLLPAEEEGRLHDPRLRENFITRIFVMRRWRELVDSGEAGPAGVVEFHARHKLLLMAHSLEHYRQAGRLAADAGRLPPSELRRQYLAILMPALRRQATPKKHANVLQHMMGYFKKHLDAGDKQELAGLIDAYRLGQVPLIAPITLLGHYVRKYDQPYLAKQVYLRPHPLALQLLNHV